MLMQPALLLLAAGMGSRYGGLKQLDAMGPSGQTMIDYAVHDAMRAGFGKIGFVIRKDFEAEFREKVGRRYENEIVIEYAFQDLHDLPKGHTVPEGRTKPWGTAHAVRCAGPAYEKIIAERTPHDVFVLAGDGPLIRAQTLRGVLERHRADAAAATLATSVIDDPTGYGRIVRDADGAFLRIVEQKNAGEDELKIREVNPSYYCFEAARLFDALSRVQRDQLSGEYYVTDVPELLKNAGERVEVVDAVPPEDVLSINTPEHLAEVARIYRHRRGMSSSVTEGASS